MLYVEYIYIYFLKKKKTIIMLVIHYGKYSIKYSSVLLRRQNAKKKKKKKKKKIQYIYIYIYIGVKERESDIDRYIASTS
jgi:hypothetical protein